MSRRRPTPAQEAALSRLGVVRQGYEGKDMIAHRILESGTFELFRISPEGQVRQL